MDELLNSITSDEVFGPAIWVDISGVNLRYLFESLQSIAGVYNRCRSDTDSLFDSAGTINPERLKELAQPLGVRFRRLEFERGIVVAGELFVARFNRQHCPWHWRPGIADLAVSWLQDHPEISPFEGDHLLHLKGEARRELSFCQMNFSELRSGTTITIQESELRGIILALYLACPHKGALPSWHYIFSPHDGDLANFANTLGIAISIPGVMTEDSEPWNTVIDSSTHEDLLLYTGLYDFRYSLPGLELPLSLYVVDELTQRIEQGLENPWDMEPLLAYLKSESERIQSELGKEVKKASRLVGLLTVIASLAAPPMPNAPLLAPFHIAAHAGAEIAMAAAAKKRRKQEESEEQEESQEGLFRV